ncbi:MAG: glutamate racemase [Candidatus Eremiobacteraeota bacterium]|nr:glutamate racemase [Candidatus Eremiobacteraeota bacterium]
MRVGVFDSGVGGLTVAARLFKELPELSIHYFGDTAHVPYGSRSAEDVTYLVCQIANYLYQSGADALVLACNTSSAVAIEAIRDECPVPVVGIIEAACRAAIEATENGRIGVLSNVLTARSGAYDRTAQFQAQRLGLAVPQVVSVGCPKLVPLIEAGKINGAEPTEALAEYLAPLLEAEVDTLVFGCTHYPFLTHLVREMVPHHVRLIDPGAFVARELEAVGVTRRLGEGAPEHRFEVSGSAADFEANGSRLMGHRLTGVRTVKLLSSPQSAAS